MASRTSPACDAKYIKELLHDPLGDSPKRMSSRISQSRTKPFAYLENSDCSWQERTDPISIICQEMYIHASTIGRKAKEP